MGGDYEDLLRLWLAESEAKPIFITPPANYSSRREFGVVHFNPMHAFGASISTGSLSTISLSTGSISTSS